MEIGTGFFSKVVGSPVSLGWRRIILWLLIIVAISAVKEKVGIYRVSKILSALVPLKE